jgi:hypothetical protein
MKAKKLSFVFINFSEMGLFKGLWPIQIEKFPLAPDSRFGCGPAPISLAAAPLFVAPPPRGGRRGPGMSWEMYSTVLEIREDIVDAKLSAAAVAVRRTPAGFSRGGLG